MQAVGIHPDSLRGKRVWVARNAYRPDLYTEDWYYAVKVVGRPWKRLNVPEGILYRHRESWM